MKSAYLPFIIFLLLFLSTILFPFDAATSVVPGWHISIFPTWFIIGVIVTIVLLLVTIAYWLLAKKRGIKPNPILFIGHILLTIPLLFYLRFPGVLITDQLNNEDEILQMLDLNRKTAISSLILFILGQVSFIIYFIRILKNKKRRV